MRRSFNVLNVKCANCANTLKKSLREEFGEVEVDLEKFPREIRLDIAESAIGNLKGRLKKLGYPMEDEEMNMIETSTTKVKSFISCAKGAV